MQNWGTPDPVALHGRGRPRHLACVDLSSGRRWSYAALDMAVERSVAALSGSYGIAPGQRVAAIARNSVELLILQQATMRLGAIFAPLNWRLSPAELERILADCTPALLAIDDAAPSLQPPPGGRIATVAEIAAAIEETPPGARRPPPPADAPCVILYTSGTSGTPKGVILTGGNLFFTAINFGVLGDVAADSVFLCDAPMFHIIGLVTTLQSALLRGATALISPGFDPIATNDRLADPALGVTHYFCVPQMADALRGAETFRPDRWRLKALFTGGAPNPPAGIRWWLSQGVCMVDGFGMTEAGTVLGMPIDREIIAGKAGAVGLPAPAVAIRLVGPDGEDVQDGAPGEILVAGPAVTPGYWNRPEERVASFTPDGWLRTGDIGRRDAEGFISVVDRGKDMFISGGENVYSVEVEAALVEHAAVAEAAVIGVPDPRWGEVGRAYVVLAPGLAVSEADLAAHCAARLGRFKAPKQFRIVESLPRTASGKLMKQRLREEARAEAGRA